MTEDRERRDADDARSDGDTEGESRFADDPERVAFLREVADDVRGESSESELVAAMLYRVSDLYDPEEETTPADIYLNMRNILRVKERGGLPDRDD